MRRIAAAQRAAEAASPTAPGAASSAAKGNDARKSEKRKAASASGDAKPRESLSSWDRLGRAVDLARRKVLVEHRKTVLTDSAGAVAEGHVKTLVELMRLQNASVEERRSILLVLGRTMQVAPERLVAFVQTGGLAALGLWLRSAAARAPTSPEQKSVALGCLRILAKLPVAHAPRQVPQVSSLVKELSHKFDWAKGDAEALQKQWCLKLLELSESRPKKIKVWMPVSESKPAAGKPTSSSPVPSNGDPNGIPNPNAAAEVGKEAVSSSSSSSASSASEDEQDAIKVEKAVHGEAAHSRFQPKKQEPCAEPDMEQLRGVEPGDENPGNAADPDADVNALLTELVSLHELLVQD